MFLSNKTSNNEKIILISVVVFSLIIRLATLEFINPSDNAYYWFSAKILLYGQDYIQWMKTFSMAHQTTRFGLIIPLFLIQKLFGTSLYVIYILPVVISVLCTVLIFRIGVLFKNSSVGFIAAILFTIFPPLIRNGSQLFPDILVSLYILSAYYVLFRYHRSDNKSILSIILAAVLSFFAYLTKEPAIFMVFGVFGALYMMERKYKELILFAVVFTFLFFSESCFYNLNFGDFLGRFHIVKSQHLVQTDFPVLNSFFELFYRYIKIPLYWKFVFYSYAFFLCYLFFKDKKADITLKAFAFIGFTFFFFTTFALKSIKPLIVAQSFQSRYLDAGIAFMMPVAGYYLNLFFNITIKKFRQVNNKDSDVNNLKTGVCLALLLVMTVIYLSAFFNFHKKTKYSEDGNKISHPLFLLKDYSYNINSLYQQGYPILFKPIDYRKTKCLLLHVILDQNSIPINDMLNLPENGSLVTGDEELYYYSKNNNIIRTVSELNDFGKYVYVGFVNKNLFYKIVYSSNQ